MRWCPPCALDGVYIQDSGVGVCICETGSGSSGIAAGGAIIVVGIAVSGRCAKAHPMIAENSPSRAHAKCGRILRGYPPAADFALRRRETFQ